MKKSSSKKALVAVMIAIPILSIVYVHGAGTPKSADFTLSLYAKDFQINWGIQSTLVIEIQSNSIVDMTIVSPVKRQAVGGIPISTNLPDFDRTPEDVATQRYTISITSYEESKVGGLIVWDSPVAADRQLHLKESIFLKEPIGGFMVGRGRNRIRVTLFKDGRAIAASNVITIIGLPRPETRPLTPREYMLQNGLRSMPTTVPAPTSQRVGGE